MRRIFPVDMALGTALCAAIDCGMKVRVAILVEASKVMGSKLSIVLFSTL